MPEIGLSPSQFEELVFSLMAYVSASKFFSKQKTLFVFLDMTEKGEPLFLKGDHKKGVSKHFLHLLYSKFTAGQVYTLQSHLNKIIERLHARD